VLADSARTIVTEESVNAWWKGKSMRITHIPATCPREEHQDKPEVHQQALEFTRQGKIIQKVLRFHD